MKSLFAGLLIAAGLAAPFAAFGYLFTHPAELRELMGPPETTCRCP